MLTSVISELVRQCVIEGEMSNVDQCNMCWQSTSIYQLNFLGSRNPWKAYLDEAWNLLRAATSCLSI